MSLGDDLRSDVARIFTESWTVDQGRAVPEPENLRLSNHAVEIEATVLYADLTGSTRLVDDYKPHFAAEIYKSYLHCAARIVRSQGGVITAYDGDRIMAVFVGDSKNDSAVRAALKINYATKKIVNPAIKAQYDTEFEVIQTVGVDTSKLFVARTGVRGANDLVWVGRAANYAAKLTELDSGYSSWITASVHGALHAGVKTVNGKDVWEARRWTSMRNHPIYCSSWWIEL